MRTFFILICQYVLFESFNYILFVNLDPTDTLVSHFAAIFRIIREISMIVMLFGICLSIRNAVRTAQASQNRKTMQSTAVSLNSGGKSTVFSEKYCGESSTTDDRGIHYAK